MTNLKNVRIQEVLKHYEVAEKDCYFRKGYGGVSIIEFYDGFERDYRVEIFPDGEVWESFRGMGENDIWTDEQIVQMSQN